LLPFEAARDNEQALVVIAIGGNVDDGGVWHGKLLVILTAFLRRQNAVDVRRGL
jgi:hypothetical protein